MFYDFQLNFPRFDFCMLVSYVFPSSFDYHVTIYLIFEKGKWINVAFKLDGIWYMVNASEDDICKYIFIYMWPFRSLTFIYRYAIMLPKTEIIAALIIATVLHQGIAILCKIHQLTLLYIFTICNLDTIYSHLNYYF